MDFIKFILEGNAHVSVNMTECKRKHGGLAMCWQAINNCHKIPKSCSTWLLLSSSSVTVTDPLGSHMLLNLRPTPISVASDPSKDILFVFVIENPQNQKCN